MLSSLEKLQYVLSGFILVVLVLLFVLLGAPQARVSFEPPKTTTTEVVDKPGESPGRSAMSDDDRAVAKKVMDVVRKHRTLRVRDWNTITKETHQLSHGTVRFLKNRSNWISELDRAGSEVIVDSTGRPTAIEIHDIDQGSFFDQFGLEDGDRLLLVDGGSHDFARSNLSAFYRIAEDGFERLESGGSVTVTLVRDGKIVHKEFRVGE